MKICPNCSAELPDEAVFCKGCGKKITDETKSRKKGIAGAVETKSEKKGLAGAVEIGKMIKELIERERRIKKC